MARKKVQFAHNPLLRGPSLVERTRAGSPYRLLPIADIDVDPDQPRRVFETESLAELAASIKEYGVLCPILVKVTEGGTYRLVTGERRLRASKLAGLETIPAVIDTSEDLSETSLAKQLVENLQREDLSPMERAVAVGQLRDRYSWSIREIARRLGTSKALVQRSLEVLVLPDDLQAALRSGASESKVLLLGQIENRELRKTLLVGLDEMSRSQLEVRIAKLKGDAEEGESKYRRGTKRADQNISLSMEDRRIVDDIQRAVGTRVHLQRSRDGKGKGRLVIEFYSKEDLEEVYRRLTA